MGNNLRSSALYIVYRVCTNLDIQTREPLLHDVGGCVEETLVGCDDDVAGADIARATCCSALQGSLKCS